MKKYLITGCAGFIGSNFVYYMLNKYDDILLVNLDKLTYAGNLENLKGVEGDKRHGLVQGDICDRALVTSLFEKYDFDFVINFAAESHVDRSITNPEICVETNVLGTVNLLQCAKNAWYRDGAWAEGRNICRCPPTKCTALWARTATLWRRRPCAPTARTLPPRQVPTCSSWLSMTPTACP